MSQQVRAGNSWIWKVGMVLVVAATLVTVRNLDLGTELTSPKRKFVFGRGASDVIENLPEMTLQSNLPAAVPGEMLSQSVERVIGHVVGGQRVTEAKGGKAGGDWRRTGLLPSSASSSASVAEKQRVRTFERISSENVPWEGVVLRGSVLGYVQKGAHQCNPMSMGCDCLSSWYGRKVCLDVGHRQKTPVNVVFYDKSWWPPNQDDLGMHDCPTTKCNLVRGREHTEKSLAFISPLKPGRFLPTIFFPPKVDRVVNRNVMLNFESSIKYKMLTDPVYYRQHDIDVYGCHTGNPVPKDLLRNGSLSYIELSDLDKPPASFRTKGPPFSERFDHMALFVSHCVGTRVRLMLLGQISQYAKVYSFGSCTPKGTIQAKVAEVYPMCAGIAESVGKMAEKECVLQHSKFSLSIENVEEHNYVTEKLYQALAMGAIPIYWGAPNAKSLLPTPKAAVLLNDFENVRQAMAYVQNVSTDERLWLDHTAWKTQPFSEGFNGLLRNQRGSMVCRVCEHLSASVAPREVPLEDIITECAQKMLNRLVMQGLPLGEPYSWLGVDAVLSLGVAQGTRGGAAVARVLGFSPLNISQLKGVDEVGRDCAIKGILERGLVAFDGLEGKESEYALEVAVAMYLVVLEGRQNTLIVGGGGEGNLFEALQPVWQQIMANLPEDYDVLVLAGESGATKDLVHPVEKGPHVAGEWLVSLKGARKLLSGQAGFGQMYGANRSKLKTAKAMADKIYAVNPTAVASNSAVSSLRSADAQDENQS